MSVFIVIVAEEFGVNNKHVLLQLTSIYLSILETYL